MLHGCSCFPTMFSTDYFLRDIKHCCCLVRELTLHHYDILHLSKQTPPQPFQSIDLVTFGASVHQNQPAQNLQSDLLLTLSAFDILSIISHYISLYFGLVHGFKLGSYSAFRVKNSVEDMFSIGF